MKVVIDGKEYAIAYSFRMYFMYERITGEAFKGGLLSSIAVLFYSALLANNEDFPLTFEQFVDALDENTSLLDEFNHFVAFHFERLNPTKKKEKEAP